MKGWLTLIGGVFALPMAITLLAMAALSDRLNGYSTRKGRTAYDKKK